MVASSLATTDRETNTAGDCKADVPANGLAIPSTEWARQTRLGQTIGTCADLGGQTGQN